MPEFVLNMDQREITIGATGYEEIAQNVRMIVATLKGSVPLDRDFGISSDLVDEPTPIVRGQLIAEIFEKVKKYEPRARVTSVEFEHSADDEREGRIVPVIYLEIEES